MLFHEESCVAAEVEDPELVLVDSVAEEVQAQAGAASHHLPELGGGVDRFEEDEVDHFGDVDAGIKHVDADGDVEAAGGVLKAFELSSSVAGGVRDHRGILAGVQREVSVELLLDEACVFLGAGEDDGFAQTVATLDLDAFGDQRVQYLADGVAVVETRVDLGG